MLAAEAPALVDALVLLSYPLHPPNRPGQLRTAHFAQFSTPALFVHGSADPFGSIEEIERARALIPGRSALIVVDGAKHDLFFQGLRPARQGLRPARQGLRPPRQGRRPGPRGADLVRRVVTEFLAFAETGTGRTAAP
jgi:hypothetical protein